MVVVEDAAAAAGVVVVALAEGVEFVAVSLYLVVGFELSVAAEYSAAVVVVVVV